MRQYEVWVCDLSEHARDVFYADDYFYAKNLFCGAVWSQLIRGVAVVEESTLILKKEFDYLPSNVVLDFAVRLNYYGAEYVDVSMFHYVEE